MKISEQAREYIDLGWSVIPIRGGEKVPKTAWNKFRKEIITDKEIDELFTEGTNIAVACGDLSGIMVIDQDFYKDNPDLETFKGIDSPLKSVTPRGGVHLYFKYKEGTQNTVNDTVKADIRSEGGYVLIPPSSVKAEDGKTGKYAWVEKPTKELLENLPEVPEQLLEALYATKTTSDTYNLDKIDYTALSGMLEGGRNNEISRVSLSMLSRGLEENIAWQTITSINQQFNPPLPEIELRKTFESAVRKNRESPSMSKNEISLNQAPKELSSAVSSLSTADDLKGVIGELMSGKKEGIKTGFDFLDTTMGGFIPGQSYLLFADTSVGKSVLAVNMLTAMAREGVETMYFDLENDMKMTLERVAFSFSEGKLTLAAYRKILSETPMDEEKLNGIFEPVAKYGDKMTIWDLNKLIQRFGDVTWAGVKQCIEEEMEKGKVKVVVIDHLHYFSPAESDHAILGEVARQLNNMAAQYNIAILLVAHTKKGLLETNKKDDTVKAIRPTVDHISGSGLIAKHFKNIIALKRNTVAQDPYDRSKTQLYVDKTKYGPAGSTEIFYCESTLVFTNNPNNVVMIKASQQMEDELLRMSDDTKLPVSKHERPVTLGELKKESESKITQEPIAVQKKENPYKSPFSSSVDNRFSADKNDVEDIPF